MRSRIFFSFFLLALTLLLEVQLSAQEVGLKYSDKLSKADSSFTAGLYQNALQEYKQLIAKYPKDPIYNYKIGVCYLQSKISIPKAIEHLKFSSTLEVPNLVYYYLGIAYQKNYQFEQATSYYKRFNTNGGDATIPPKEVESLLNQCENGNFMLRYIYQPNIIDKKRVHKNEFSQFIITKSSSGNFTPIPSNLKTAEDVKRNHSSLMFFPSNPKIGDKIVFSSFGSTSSFGKDLFLIEMLNDGLWSKPINLGEIVNSKHDEDFPYLAPDGVTLYFCSKGHYSMGGFDLYRSIFDPASKQWSSPENIGFPFSSTFDDFLYIPDAVDEFTTLVTNRNSLPDSVDVVLIKIDQNPIRRSIDSNEAVLAISRLDVDKKKTKQSAGSNDKPKEQDSKPKPQAKPSSAKFTDVENDPEYARELANGFTQQMRADSLRQRLETLRARFDVISTAEARRALEAQVVKVEDSLLEAQRNADINFGRASQIEQEYLTGKRKSTDKPLSTFATDHPDFLYQAQFAPTVFQADELKKLSELEQLVPQLNRLRENITKASAKIAELESNGLKRDSDYESTYSQFIKQLQTFNPLMSMYIGGKKRLYLDCISVALIKAGANSNTDIKNHIDLANSQFRASKAIRNNTNPESVFESEYEALQLDELGVARLEVAFASLWEMNLFQQQLLSKVYRIEKSIFGRILQEPISKKVVEVLPDVTTPQIVITRDQIQPLKTDSIVFKEEVKENPSFQVLENTPYSKENPFQSHDPLPLGVVYKIQLAAFSNPVKFEFFKGMVPISAELLTGGRVTKYYAGLFSNQDDADKALPIVRSLGFKDAFIVAWHNGRTVTLTRAKSLEQHQVKSTPKDAVRIDIVKDAKSYVIQLGSYQGRLPADLSQTIRALAPGKDIIRKPDSKDSFIYSIGSYSDINEATRVKDNLVASGIKSAAVIAVDTDN
jgi:hypothetical protein